MPACFARQQWDLALLSLFRADSSLGHGFFACAAEELVGLWPVLVEQVPAVPDAVSLPALEALRCAHWPEAPASPEHRNTLRWVLEAVLSRTVLCSGSVATRFKDTDSFIAAVAEALSTGGGRGWSVRPGLRLVDLCSLLFSRIED